MTYKIALEGFVVTASTPAEVLALVRELNRKRPYRKATKTDEPADAEQAASPDVPHDKV